MNSLFSGTFLESLGIYFSHFDRWPFFILFFLMLFAMAQSSRLRKKMWKLLKVEKNTLSGFSFPIYRNFKNRLFILGVFFALLATLGPQWGQKEQIVKMQGLDMCFALDLSRSMLAEDVAPSRLQQIKNQLTIYFQNLGGDRAAIVGFAGNAFLAAPLSNDALALSQFLDPLDPSFVSNPSTLLSNGIDACFEALGLENVKTRDEILDGSAKVIVLLSDGEDTLEEDNGPIKKAVKLGIPVYAMAAGTARGGMIPIRNERGEQSSYVKDPATGQPAITKLEDKALKKIAEQTDAQVFYSSEGLDAWKKFSKAIESYKRDSREAGTKLDREERFQIPLFVAFLLLLLDFFLPEAGIGKVSLGKVKYAATLYLLLWASTALSAELKPQAVYHNNKALGEIQKKNLRGALDELGEAIAQDASQLETRFNFATTKLFNSVNESGEVDKKTIDESIQELESIQKELKGHEKEYPADFGKQISHQLGQAYDVKQDRGNALKNYYNSLQTPGSSASATLDRNTKNNIARLLSMPEKGSGSGGGQDKDEKSKDGKDGKDSKGNGQGNKNDNKPLSRGEGQNKPKFTGSDVNEDQARQILQSVAGEEREIQRRNAKAEAKRRAKDGQEGQVKEGPGQKPW